MRDHLSEVVDRVERQHERVIITRNGHDAAVVISTEDLAQLEETIAVLSDPEALADIREATPPTPAATSSAASMRCAVPLGERPW
ncbi:MAG: type II toxin-antitoxin system Phd/YefM family antitoxin [Actinomycetota bacterium]|nr:type II toxin-antitoxin system Phd/YefM family antitoxin [Actinomycetota bacterium]